MTPRTLFRTFAFAEMVTWAILITALILRGTGVSDLAVPIGGSIHGFVFLCYGATTIFVWVNQKWRPGVGIIGLITAIIPFATVPFEIAIDRKGLLTGDWRLAPGRELPRTFPEHVQAWVLRRPILSVVLVVILIAIVFTVLLWLGPPVPRG